MFLLTSPTSTAESRLSLEKSAHRNLDCWFFQSTVLLDGVRDILPGITPTNISNPFLSREGRHPQDTPRSWEQSGLSRSYFAVSYRLSFNFNSINDRWGMMPETKLLVAYWNLSFGILMLSLVQVAKNLPCSFVQTVIRSQLSKRRWFVNKNATENFSSVEGDFQITIGIGLCEMASEDDVHSAMKRAEEARYRAKKKAEIRLFHRAHCKNF